MTVAADYSPIDPTLYSWALKHKLHIFTIYKDEVVRSVEIVSHSAKRYQIWVDALNENDEVCIHAWDYKKKRTDIKSSLSELNERLEEIYSIVLSWEGDNN
jgi:hypothetical protein